MNIEKREMSAGPCLPTNTTMVIRLDTSLRMQQTHQDDSVIVLAVGQAAQFRRAQVLIPVGRVVILHVQVPIQRVRATILHVRVPILHALVQSQLVPVPSQLAP